MVYNMLLVKLANKLSENALRFKEIKLQSSIAYGIPELENATLPSGYFSILNRYNIIGPLKLQQLYFIYQNSNLVYEAKEEAYRCIEEYNFNFLSHEGTKVLKHIVSEIILQPINTTEIQKLAEKVPIECRTPEMQLDQKTSIMKLCELDLIHAFNINVLYEVFKNNSNIVKNIIDPNWNKIKSLYNTYMENSRPFQQQQRPTDVRISPGSPGQQPSPVEHISPAMTHPWATYPVAPATEPIIMPSGDFGPHPAIPFTNPGYQNWERYSPTSHPSSPPSDITYLQSPPQSIVHELQSGPESNKDSIWEDEIYAIPFRDRQRNVYPGECVIINIEKFNGSESMDRVGSHKDVENIKKTFEEMDFKVSIQENLTSEQLMDYMRMRADDTSLYNVGVFVCFLMSHGEEGMISGSDGEHVEIDKIINSFKNDKCAALKGKPKVFFVQACRGSIVDAPLNGLKTDNSEGEPRNVSAQPQDADLIVCQATTKGKVAVRTDAGSWYIDTVCYVIRKTYHYEDLNGMHTKINNRISKKGENGASTLQVSNVNQSLRKKVIFKPNTKSELFLRNNLINFQPKFFAIQ